MQAILSYEQSPPLAAPVRFFLTAPIFGVLAGLLILWRGPDVFVSRWVPETLALTHLMTTGFMLQVMLGALLQILPVIAGANMRSPLRVAGTVHASLTLAALCLAAAFLFFSPHLFKISALFFAVGAGVFVVSAALSLRGVPSSSATVRGLKLSLGGLLLTVTLGVGLTAVLGWSFSLPLMLLTDIHLGWGFAGWGLMLLVAVAYVVVPMFQVTPAYPAWFERWFAPVVLAVLVFWSLAYLAESAVLSTALAVALLVAVALFALATLRQQGRSKRAQFDASQRGWQLAMWSALASVVVWIAALLVPSLNEWQGWPLLCGVLVLFGGFTSVIIGMLDKIVPFLVWLHLQNAGRQRGKPVVLAPNMKKIIPEIRMARQLQAHAVACGLLVLAVFVPAWFAYPAGLALVLAQGWLLFNLVSAMRVHRRHLQLIAAKQNP